MLQPELQSSSKIYKNLDRLYDPDNNYAQTFCNCAWKHDLL